MDKIGMDGGWVYRWVDGCMDGCMDGWVDAWMGGWMVFRWLDGTWWIAIITVQWLHPDQSEAPLSSSHPSHPRLSFHLPESLLISHGAIRWSLLVLRQQLIPFLPSATQHPAES